MNKYLPENIDDFFTDNLNNYNEDPGENMWDNIVKQLPSKKQKKLSAKYVCIAAAIAIGITLPYLLFDVQNRAKYIITTNAMHQNLNKQQIFTNKPFTANLLTIPVQKTNSNSYSILSSPYQSPASNISTISRPMFWLAAVDNEQTLSNHYLNPGKKLLPGIVFKNIAAYNNTANKIGSNKEAVKHVDLSYSHCISIIPFFSFDHISGRFIEQYEFDNQDKNDYSKREKPDMSFTGGALVEYGLSKKFSVIAGLSFSNSNISITSTAVKALKDESGVYKFKLATSYGLAEISKSGVDPTAGDSLLISDAAMQFNYISLPVFLSYNISNRKIKLNVHGGVSFNKMTGVRVNADYTIQNNEEAETINKVEGLKKTFFTINTGCDLSYCINKIADISLSPELRYGINSINKGTPVKTYPVNYGLALGLHFKL